MADNFSVTAGAGTTVATDDIAGVHYQRVKAVLGADGAATDMLGGAGAVAAGVQRVTLASDDPAVAALQLLDNAIAGSEMQVDVVAALPTGANIVGRVGIDQTTDGTTNKVSVDASLRSGTATRTTVSSVTTSVTILASSSTRKGAVICNTDANALLLDLSGGTAATSRFQQRLTQYQSYEIPAGYTGAITGVWEADGTGQADVVQFT